MWNVKSKGIPVIIRTNGTISKSPGQYLSNILEKHEIKELQNAAILGAAHTLWSVLMWKYKMFIIGNVVMCTINCGYRTAATLCTLGTWFDLGI